MRMLIALLALVLAAACGGGTTAPADRTAWATGTWVAVRMNGQPLPYRSPTNAFPYTRSDSLVILILGHPLEGQGGVFPSQTFFATPTSTGTPLLCYEGFPTILVTATTVVTSAHGVLTSGSNCNSAFVDFSLTRKGDSLAGIWSNVDVRLVKR